MHYTTKQYNTRQERKCNVMNQGEWNKPIGILGGRDEWKIYDS